MTYTPTRIPRAPEWPPPRVGLSPEARASRIHRRRVRDACTLVAVIVGTTLYTGAVYVLGAVFGVPW